MSFRHRAAIALLILAPATSSAEQSWVSGGSGGLHYGAAANGDRVPDFSEAGYGRAGEAIPSAPVRETLAPTAAGDDALRIQAALNRVAALPVVNGLRGAVVLRPGRYRIGTTLRVWADGLVLRGSGSSTVLIAGAGAEPLVWLGSAARWQRGGSSIPIVDNHVPVGATLIRLASTAGLKIGDGIIVERPFTKSFIALIGMDRLAQKAAGPVTQWSAGGGLHFYRHVTAISGNAVSLDAPVMDAISRADGASVWRAQLVGAAHRAGVEQLSAEGMQDPRTRGISAGSTFVRIDGVEDGWVRQIRLAGFATYANVRANAVDITIDDVSGRLGRPAWWKVPQPVFSVAGQRVLVSHCAAESDRATLATTQARTAGPIVFLDCRASGGAMSAGPHQRWAAGVLFDGVVVPGGLLVENRGSMGSGQGWAGTSVVLWNSSGAIVSLQEAPGTHNWAFGTAGRRKPVPEGIEPGTDISPGRPVAPASLFEAQLAARQ